MFGEYSVVKSWKVGVFAVILTLIISSLFVNTKRIYTRLSPYYWWLLTRATMIALWIMRVKVDAEGLEKLPDEPFLLVSNHRSKYDPIVTWHILRKRPIAFITKPENLKVVVFGRIVRRCCFMPIDRQDPRKAIGTINAAADLLRRGEMLVGVYPEGTRNSGAELLPFHNGVFKIAKKAEAPIVVLGINGADRIKKRLFLGHRVKLTVLDVIDAQTVKENRDIQLGERIRDQLAQHTKIGV